MHGCAVVMSPQLGTDPWEPNAVILPDGSCCFLNATKRVLKLESCAVRQKLSLLLAKSSLDEYPDWWRSPGLAKCSEFVVLMFSTLPLISTLLFQEVICAFFFPRSFTFHRVWEEKVLVCLLFISKTLVSSHSCAYHLFKWRLRVSSRALEIKRHFEMPPLTASQG